jgi:hypothetical protein
MHLGNATKKQIEELQRLLLNWLERHDISGSVADQYSLYTAIDEEYEKAQQALTMVYTDEEVSH